MQGLLSDIATEDITMYMILQDASIMAVMLREGGDFGKNQLVVFFSMAVSTLVSSGIVEASNGKGDQRNLTNCI